MLIKGTSTHTKFKTSHKCLWGNIACKYYGYKFKKVDSSCKHQYAYIKQNRHKLERRDALRCDTFINSPILQDKQRVVIPRKDELSSMSWDYSSLTAGGSSKEHLWVVDAVLLIQKTFNYLMTYFVFHVVLKSWNLLGYDCENFCMFILNYSWTFFYQEATEDSERKTSKWVFTSTCKFSTGTETRKGEGETQ